MAYMSQEHKKQLAPSIKAVLKKYGVKASIGVNHRSTLGVNIQSSKLDIIGNYNANCKEDDKVNHDYMGVNEHWIDSSYTGVVRDFLNELKSAMMQGNHDDSDIMTDYFNVGWYIDINVGNWDKPYILLEA